ncbi:2-oxoacid:acceptor oxidoreductase family protein [bacterium]|nr:2-oxoacid:acceptor oxidoreductase family protein [bacterium]MBU1983988.1 2-oxoacid:acceptor oxidoreductase family protein [bacterium]
MATNVLKKSPTFYDHFERWRPTQNETTHYCPGCGHGNVHKLIAEALGDLGLADRGIFVSPVGCSVFAYYYFDTGNIQAAHGRAPAVGTGLKRVHPHSIVMTYQGDGDLASIGGLEILHAANRGENMTVFFINNAIYGMTGGQMAATTLIGQKTTTSPYGRTIENEGYPLRMSELLATLEAPVLVERCHLADAKGIMACRKAVRKAIQNQAEGKGFSFVEILSPCPTGWKMTSLEAEKFIKEKMMPVFPVQVFRDESATREGHFREPKNLSDQEMWEALDLGLFGETHPLDKEFLENFKTTHLKFAGFGGQGVLTAGVILAAAGMQENLHVSWIPSYGPEMRGGTANASVVLSKDPIGSPLVVDPDVLVAMNDPSLDSFENSVVKGGLIIVNSSIISRKVRRKDVVALYIPLTDIAAEHGITAAANMVLLGAYLEYSKLLPVDSIKEIIPIGIKRKQLVEANLRVVDAGVEWIRKSLSDGKHKVIVPPSRETESTPTVFPEVGK